MFFSQYIKQKIAYGFLVLFALMMLNGIVFTHSHKLANGTVITHAHPYKPVGNSPYQPNNHSTNELVLLDGIFNTVFTSLTLAVVLGLVLRSGQLLPVYQSYHQATDWLFSTPDFYSRRGPPVLMFFI
jgi:hypothetical protein